MELCAAQKNSAHRVAKEEWPPFFRPFPTIQLVIFPLNKRQIRSGFYKGFLRFLPGSAQNIECDVTYSKQSIGKFLPGATTTCSVAQFLTEFRAAPDAQRKRESASRDASEQGKIPLKEQNEKEPS